MKLINPNPENFNKNYIYFNDPIQNTIINESRFIRIIYSTPNIIFNGINVLVSFVIEGVDKQYNKNIINYCITKNEKYINIINNIEKTILDKYCSNKRPSYNLASQVASGSLKLFSDSFPVNFMRYDLPNLTSCSSYETSLIYYSMVLIIMPVSINLYSISSS